MTRWALAVALLIGMLLLGCAPEPTLVPAPTPARPSLTEREAIAVVKSWLAHVPASDSNCLALVRLFGRELTWTGEYLGMGEWLVSAKGGFTSSWRVFEASGSVISDSHGHDLLTMRGC